jgi:hypothetical protein
MREEAGRVSGAGSLPKRYAARARWQLSNFTRVVSQQFSAKDRIWRKAAIRAAWYQDLQST